MTMRERLESKSLHTATFRFLRKNDLHRSASYLVQLARAGVTMARGSRPLSSRNLVPDGSMARWIAIGLEQKYEVGVDTFLRPNII